MSYGALVRIFGSKSRYGDPFQVPLGSPLRVELGERTLEVHFGRPPSWMPLAVGRRRALGQQKLRVVFNGEKPDFDAVGVAVPATLVDETKFSYSVTLCVVQAVGPLDMARPESLNEVEKQIFANSATMDLVVDLLREFIPNLLNEQVDRDGAFLSEREDFCDAFGLPRWSAGGATAFTTAPCAFLEDILASASIGAAMVNCMTVSPAPRDVQRLELLENAGRTGRLRDSAGFFGKSELLRDIQIAQMRITAQTKLWMATSTRKALS